MKDKILNRRLDEQGFQRAVQTGPASMHLKQTLRRAGFLAVFIIVCGASASSIAGDTRSACTGSVDTTGVYRNYSYGFTLTIPRNLKGQWNSPMCAQDSVTQACICMSDHGRDVPLEGGGVIAVFTAFNATDSTLATSAFTDLAGFKGKADDMNFSVSALSKTRLGTMPAYTYIATRTIDDETLVREALVAQTADATIQYTLYIEAPQAQYDKYRPTFYALVKSWRASPIK